MSKLPIKLGNLKGDTLNKQILRIGIIAELDAINLYEQLSNTSDSEEVKKVLLDIAKEEKTHVGEFLTLLLKLDKEQERELKKGKEEVEEITK